MAYNPPIPPDRYGRLQPPGVPSPYSPNVAQQPRAGMIPTTYTGSKWNPIRLNPTPLASSATNPGTRLSPSMQPQQQMAPPSRFDLSPQPAPGVASYLNQQQPYLTGIAPKSPQSQLLQSTTPHTYSQGGRALSPGQLSPLLVSPAPHADVSSYHVPESRSAGVKATAPGTIDPFDTSGSGQMIKIPIPSLAIPVSPTRPAQPQPGISSPDYATKKLLSNPASPPGYAVNQQPPSISTMGLIAKLTARGRKASSRRKSSAREAFTQQNANVIHTLTHEQIQEYRGITL
jgi:hypothetical protein